MLKKGCFQNSRGNIQSVSVVKLLLPSYVFTSMTSSNSHCSMLHSTFHILSTANDNICIYKDLEPLSRILNIYGILR